MNKLARVLIIAVATTIALSAFGSTALADEARYTKYWTGPGGETVCEEMTFAGQSFSAQAETPYNVKVDAVVGHASAKIRFLLKEDKWSNAVSFSDSGTGFVPKDAVEAWVTICHTTLEVSYGAAIYIPPVAIHYGDGLK